MSTERDELAREVFIADNANQSREDSLKDWAEYDFASEQSYAHTIADGLIAAGYRKPRTVTTAEELDALPVGSVILDPGGNSVHKTQFEGWCASNGMRTIMRAEITDALPATVLWEPLP